MVSGDFGLFFVHAFRFAFVESLKPEGVNLKAITVLWEHIMNGMGGTIIT